MTDFNPTCPWSVCRCTHTECVRGWLPEQPGITAQGNKSEAVARRCPVCDAARQNLPWIPPREGVWAMDDPQRRAAGDRFDVEGASA